MQSPSPVPFSDLAALRQGLLSLCVFRNVLQDPVMEGLLALTAAPKEERVSAYSELAARLYARGTDLSQYLLTLALEDENIYMLIRAEGKTPDPLLEEAVSQELAILEGAAALTPDWFQSQSGCQGWLPGWDNRE